MAKTIEEEILDVYGVPGRKRGERAQTYYGRLVAASNDGTDEECDARWAKLGVPAQEWLNNGVTAKKAGNEILGFPDAPEVVDEPPPEEEVAAPPPSRRAPAPKSAAKEAAEDEHGDAEKEERRPSRTRRTPVEAPPRAAPPRAATAPVRAPRTRGRKSAAAPAPAPKAVETKPAPAPTPARRRLTTAEPAPTRRRGRGRNGEKPGIYRETQEFVVMNPNATTAEIVKALKKKGFRGLDDKKKQHSVQSVRGHTRDTLKILQAKRGFDVGIIM